MNQKIKLWNPCTECPIFDNCILKVKKVPRTKICLDQLFDTIINYQEDFDAITKERPGE